MLKRICIILGFIFACTIASCRGTPTTKTPEFRDYQANPTVTKADDIVVKVNEGMAGRAGDIKSETDKIKSEANNAGIKAPSISPHMNRIRVSADTIRDKAAEIELLREELDVAHAYLLTAKGQIKKMESITSNSVEAQAAAEARLAEAIEREQDATRSMLRWLIVLCVVAGGLGIALMFFGHIKTGMMLGVSSAGVLVLAITVTRYFDYIAYGGLALLGVAIAVFIYQFFRRQKALEEAIETTEVAKQNLLPRERRKLFGYGAEKGLVYGLQSRGTEGLVQQARKKMKRDWEHTYETEYSREMDKQEMDIKVEALHSPA